MVGYDINFFITIIKGACEMKTHRYVHENKSRGTSLLIVTAVSNAENIDVTFLSSHTYPLTIEKMKKFDDELKKYNENKKDVY
jgi:hypothetical protein